jgi:outer membrane immunogenic protein
MKKLLLATAALTALMSAPGLAADLARPAPVYLPPARVIVPVFSWTGFYVGANAGGGWQNSDYTTVLTNCTIAGACGAGGLVFGDPANQALGSALGTGSGGRSSGFIGGFQIGYNYQVSSVVLGIEADWDYFKRSNSQGGSGIASTGDSLTVANQTGANWLATVRGRGGLAWDRLLVYVTGGAAFTKLDYTQTMVTTLGVSSGNTSVSQTKTGWTVGGGLEYAFTNNWSGKIEYLYAQFSGVSGAGALVSTAPPGFSNTFTGATSDFHDHILRAGINYKFF